MAFGRIGQTLTEPQIPAAGIAPTDPSQVGLWQKFQQRLQSDPNLRMALLTTGLNLLRSQKPGETGFDVFSNAALSGVSTLDQLRQRDVATERQEGLDELTERRTVATERNTATAERRAAASASEAKERLEIMRETNKIRRQEAENRAKTVSGSASTGQERVISADIQALVTTDPETYPDTPEGRAKARLVVQDLHGTQDRLGQARILRSIMDDIRESNLEAVTFQDAELLSEDEILQRAITVFRGITADVPEAGDLDGQIIPSVEGKGEGVVRKVGNDRYVVDFPGGATSQLTGAQVREIQRRQLEAAGQ